MSIPELREKCKNYVHEYLNEEVFLVALIILVGMGGFGLGRLSFIDSKRQGEPVTIEYNEALPAAAQSAAAGLAAGSAVKGSYVASKNSDKYHLPWCSGASRISEDNKVWFTSKEEAEASGYTPAGNCKGI